MVSTLPPSAGDRTPGESTGDIELLHRLREELAGEFDVLRHIGEESFGSLFLAHEVALRRSVVIKVLSRGPAATEEIRRRFERAGIAVGRISHPAVVPVFRVGKLQDDTPYYVEPYLGECTLGERLSALGRFPAEQVRPILRDLAGALAAAHRKGIIHRGLHPEAVRCEEGSGRVLLTDFGLSGLIDWEQSHRERLTPTGQVLGSAGYMSPEQQERLPATDRSDVYSLGLLAWRLLTGPKASFPSLRNHSDEWWRTWEESVADAGLTDLIRRCLAENPHDRPSADDVFSSLESESVGGTTSGSETFWFGLMRRRIPQALLLYFPAAWIGLQVTDQLVQQSILPRIAYLLMLVTAAAALPAALTVAWYHGPKGRQHVTRKERWLLAVVGMLWLVAFTTTWIRAGK